MKWLSILWQFVLRHLPRFLHWSANHVEDVIGDCDICAESGEYPCEDCLYLDEEVN